MAHRAARGPCPLLVEREVELGALWREAAAAERGTARLAVVTGEPGAGKTRLWTEFLASLPDHWRHLVVAGGPGGAPFLALVPEVPADGDPAAGLAQGLAQALASWAGTDPGPRAVVFEDLHEIDPVGVAAVGLAVRELGPHPILLLATYRQGVHGRGSPHERAMASLLRQPGTTEVRLDPLSPDGVEDMARAMGVTPGLDVASTEAIHERTGGNPFFTEEVLRSPTTDLPWTVGEAVSARLVGLTDDGVAVARVLAVAGTALTRPVLERLAYRTAAGATELLDAALAVAPSPGEICLRHPLVAETIVRNLPLAEKRHLHRSLAEVLEAEAANPATLAHHWQQAGNIQRAAHLARAAADEARVRRAYRTATELYKLATAYPPDDVVERCELYGRAATAAAMAGLISDCLRWVEEAEAAGTEAGQEWRAMSLYVNPALDHLPRGGRAENAPAALLERADAALRGGAPDAAGLASEAAALLGDEGEPDLLRAAGLTMVYAGAVEEGGALLEGVGRRAERSGTMRDAAMAYADLARVAAIRGDYEDAVAMDRAALRCARAETEAVLWPPMLGGLAFVCALRGDFDETARLTGELETIGMPFVAEFARFVASVVDIERGELESVRPHIDRAVTLCSLLDAPHLTVVVHTTRARLHLLRGDYALARDDLDAAARAVGGVAEESFADRMLLQARVAVAMGSDAELSAARLAMNDLARGDAGAAVVAAADAISAIAARAAGDLEAAAKSFGSAARSWERAPRLPLAAEAWCEAAECAMAANAARAAITAVERGVPIADRLGLRPLLDRFAVVSDAARRNADSVPPEFARLTSREVEIVRLVASGRTNREVARALHISEITARNHLSHIFAKVGVSRRSALVALAARLGVGG